MRCHGCDHENRDGARFCEECGAAQTGYASWASPFHALQLIINTLPHPIYLKDRDSNYIMVNRAMADHHGMPVEKFRGFPTSHLPNRSPEEIQAILAADRRVIESGKRVDIPEIEVRLSGQRRGWQHMIKLPLRDGDGNVTGIVGLAEDITQRKETELALLQVSARAEQATRLKDKFVSLIAHDLRAPVSAVLGLMRMLAPEGGAADAGRMELYQRAVERLNAMSRLIDVVLDISRIQSGDLQLRKSRCLGLDVTLPAINLKPIAELKGVRLINEVPDDGEFWADPVYLGEVIQNLAGNAIKFSRPGGTVTIYVPIGKPTTIAVRDTGVGVPPQLVPDLFRHDVKTTTLGTDGEVGTGLGLPLCHDIMHAHGGRLYLESIPGQGSTFFAELPPRER